MSTGQTKRRLDKLDAFIRGSTHNRDTFAAALGISVSYLHRVIAGAELPSPGLCARIERLTRRSVHRPYLRPDVFGNVPMVSGPQATDVEIPHDLKRSTAR